ncbi:BEN domain-containing protein 5-like isoform X1 [Dermacentor albipictus]|uniref:BEN domain-containing protein 5-like isoform X1 n=2 Tax=Dermacentor albipictus TaxID=60249 RepID=UPI0031FCF6BC
MFIYVEYEHSLKAIVVEHTRVRCSPTESFSPEDTNDFNRARTYYVRSCHKDRIYEAVKIIHMTETLEEMATFRGTRPRRPVEAEQNDCEMNTWATACRDGEHIQEQQRQRQIDDALLEYGLSPLPTSDPTEFPRKLQAVMEEVDRLKRQRRCSCACTAARSDDLMSKSAYTQLKRKYEALLEKVGQLEKRNMDHQECQRLKISRSEGSLASATARDVPAAAIQAEAWAAQHVPNGNTPTQEDNPEPDASSENVAESADDDSVHQQRTDHRPPENDYMEDGIKTLKIGSAREDGKIYAGRHFWIEKQDWDTLFSAPTDVRFCSVAASLFWTPEELSERSVTGLPARYPSPHDKALQPRPPLTPEKLDTLKDLFRIYAGKDAFTARRLNAVRRHLSNKICDIRRAKYRRRRKKNANKA